MLLRLWSFQFSISNEIAFIVFTWLSFVIFLDRGVIPGSTVEFNAFIVSTTKSSRPDVMLGLLQSAFIIGLVLGSIVFGHLVSSNDRFFLIGVGVSVWVCAVFVSGLAGLVSSYVLLLLARMCSGFGEACLFCAVPPWIQMVAPPARQGGWLGFFYTTIPVGTACGYAYSAALSASIGWEFAYFFEAIATLPFLVVLFSMTEENVDVCGKEIVPAEKHSIWDELRLVLARPVFVAVCLGNTAQAAVLVGLSTFGSAFLLGLGYFESETVASTMFGALISVAGIIATPLGGLLVDYIGKNNAGEQNGENRYQSLRRVSMMLYWSALLSAVLFSLLFFCQDATSFLALMVIACGITFLTNAAIALAELQSVPTRLEAFAFAVASVVMHLAGDVPSPIVVGWLKDTLAPSCTSINEPETAAVSDACRAESDGLRWCMFIVSLWMFWAVVCFCFAWQWAEHSTETWGIVRADVTRVVDRAMPIHVQKTASSRT